jgi:hypothetical protein
MGFGPWLLPALQRYAVPVADRLMLADELLGRLARLIGEMVASAVAAEPGARLFVADSMSAGVTLSAAESKGVSGDWVNEIHLTRGGYRKCCQKAWEPLLDPLLDRAPA